MLLKITCLYDTQLFKKTNGQKKLILIYYKTVLFVDSAKYLKFETNQVDC
jgi:hypothetical protein